MTAKMTEVDVFIDKLLHNYDDVNTREADDIVNGATDLIYGNSDKEEVRKIAYALVKRFISGYNSCIDVAKFLDNDKGLSKNWERARQSVFSGNNSGWSMCVKQLLRDLSD